MDDLDLAPCDASSDSLLGVRVLPGASRPGITGTWNGLVRVSVHAPPQDGRANSEVIAVLAKALGLRPSGLELVRGERSRQKSIRLPLPVEEARRRLCALLG